jgi:hypothetical protein
MTLEFEQFRKEVVDYYDNKGRPPEERLAEDETNWVFHSYSNPHVYIGYALTETELGEPFPMLLCYKVAYWAGEENPWRFAMGESTRSSFHAGQTLEEADTKAWNALWGTLTPGLPEQP